eukprot:TRINITY_DN991_c0_g2_i5.p1 TRINITY_DN991_c0_g2~~TRINITY_DN991_c0_g2_i5.p1  ORF type:complete len:825 (+),score=239.29 TRINITY_DN991_c0_g2_i5:46-2475(+)
MRAAMEEWRPERQDPADGLTQTMAVGGALYARRLSLATGAGDFRFLRQLRSRDEAISLIDVSAVLTAVGRRAVAPELLRYLASCLRRAPTGQQRALPIGRCVETALHQSSEGAADVLQALCPHIATARNAENYAIEKLLTPFGSSVRCRLPPGYAQAVAEMMAAARPSRENTESLARAVKNLRGLPAAPAVRQIFAHLPRVLRPWVEATPPPPPVQLQHCFRGLAGHRDSAEVRVVLQLLVSAVGRSEEHHGGEFYVDAVADTALLRGTPAMPTLLAQLAQVVEREADGEVLPKVVWVPCLKAVTEHPDTRGLQAFLSALARRGFSKVTGGTLGISAVCLRSITGVGGRSVIAAIAASLQRDPVTAEHRTLSTAIATLRQHHTPEGQQLLVQLAAAYHTAVGTPKFEDVERALRAAWGPDRPAVRALFVALRPVVRACWGQRCEGWQLCASLRALLHSSPECCHLISELRPLVGTIEGPPLSLEKVSHALGALSGKPPEFGPHMSSMLDALTPLIVAVPLKPAASPTTISNCLYGISDVPGSDAAAMLLLPRVSQSSGYSPKTLGAALHSLSGRQDTPATNALLRGLTAKMSDVGPLDTYSFVKCLSALTGVGRGAALINNLLALPLPHGPIEPIGLGSMLYSLRRQPSLPHVRALLQRVVLLIPRVQGQVPQSAVAAALHGLVGQAESPETAALLTALVPFVRACKEPLTPRAVGTALFGLRGQGRCALEMLGVLAPMVSVGNEGGEHAAASQDAASRSRAPCSAGRFSGCRVSRTQLRCARSSHGWRSTCSDSASWSTCRRRRRWAG